MKKVISILMIAFAMSSMVACGDEKDNKPDDGTDTYAQLIVGTWRVGDMTLNGENMTPDNMLITMNEGGTGVISNNGVTENNEFTWSLSGAQLTITHNNGQSAYTINSLTETECTFSGNTVPATDIEGAVVVHLVKMQ